MQKVATYCTSIHRHACTWFTLNMYQHCVVKIEHHLILKISQPMHAIFITCQHMVIFSYTSMHGGWWIQRKKIWIRKKRPQAWIWFIQYIYIVYHELTAQLRICYSGTCVLWTPWDQPTVQIIKMSWFSRSVYMIKHHLVSYISVWIMQVTSLSSVLHD